MKKPFLLLFFIVCACQPTSQEPRDFDDLLTLTDTTEEQICSLPLTEFAKHLTPKEIEIAKTNAFNLETVIDDYADDPISQIRVLFRRAALKRRLNVNAPVSEFADEFYKTLETNEGTPITLTGFHDEMHYWMDRIAEQSEYGSQDSQAYSIRFCVINEKRAELHAASRKDIIERVKLGVKLPAPELIENINHETSFSDGFAAEMLAKVFTEENAKQLTSLARAKMRSDQSILPFDPLTAELFWEERDEEISAILEFIGAHNFSAPSEKLEYMTDIDQSLRKLWSDKRAEKHFETTEEFESFKEGISKRVIKVDEFNTTELQKMLLGRGWFRDDLDGSGAAHNAWLIAQHADRNPDFQIKALELIETDLDSPGVSKSNYAYLYDRIQMRFEASTNIPKRLQRYGTQGRCTGPGTWEPFPVESPERIDDIRAEVGLETMTQYKSRFKNICKEDQR